MMEFFYYLLILWYVSTVSCKPVGITLTHFNSIENYTSNLLQHTNFYTGDQSNRLSRISLCERLLAAPLFEINIEHAHKLGHPIINRRGEINEQQLEFQSSGSFLDINANKTFPIGSQKYNFQSTTCLAHDSTFSWIVVFQSDMHMGLLFKINPFEDEAIPKLFALVDTSPRMVNTDTRDKTIGFLQSLNQSNSIEDETLCHLKTISQFRICSICANGLHKTKKYVRHNVLRNPYPDPNYNFQFEDSFGDCPTISIPMYFIPGKPATTATIYNVRALQCRMQMGKYSYTFYVKMNWNVNDGISPNSVYVIEANESYQLKGEVHVSQMHYFIYLDQYM